MALGGDRPHLRARRREREREVDGDAQGAEADDRRVAPQELERNASRNLRRKILGGAQDTVSLASRTTRGGAGRRRTERRRRVGASEAEGGESEGAEPYFIFEAHPPKRHAPRART